MRRGGDSPMKLNILLCIRTNHPRTAAKKKRRLRVLRLYVMIFSLLSSFVMTLGSTFAWFTVEDSVVNNLYSRTYDTAFCILLMDDFTPPDVPPGKGDTFDKTVGAKNVGLKPGVVRLLVEPTLIAANGETLPATVGVSDATVLIIDPGGDWLDGGDGFFYYRYILEPGQTAQNLFTQLQLSPDLDEAYQNAQLNIEVRCDTVGLIPPDGYRDKWWKDQMPLSGKLLAVDDALQTTLGR